MCAYMYAGLDPNVKMMTSNKAVSNFIMVFVILESITNAVNPELTFIHR